MDNVNGIEEVLNEIGYIKQVTPAGRIMWVNPKFLLTEAELAEQDDYADETYDDYLREQDEDMGMDRYDSWSELED